MTPRISLIAAIAENGVIGANGKIPWRLSTDMRRFKQLTIGKPVIMGRKTADSLGVPLVDRSNIVVTSSDLWEPEFIRVTSIDEAFEVARSALDQTGGNEIFVIGGGQLYAETIARADRLYITRVAAAPEGDTFFPPFDEDDWKVVESEAVPAGERDSAASTFIIYDRAAPRLP